VSTSTTPDRTTPKPARAKRSRYRGIDHLSPVDRVVVSLMIGIPTLLVLWLVVVPAVGSVLLSFTNWDGIGPISSAKVVGIQNYKDVLTIYPPFVPALHSSLRTRRVCKASLGHCSHYNLLASSSARSQRPFQLQRIRSTSMQAFR